MSSVLFSLPELYEAYKHWVVSNPLIISDFETSAKWLSYFIAGRVNNSYILTELVYSLSNLLVFFNDRIIRHAKNIQFKEYNEIIKTWLTVVEYSEVFLELSAKRLFGEAGKWLLVTIVQLFKCLLRLVLLYKRRETIILSPAIPVLKRKNIVEKNIDESIMEHSLIDPSLTQVSFTLKRSGRVIRKIQASPPISLRTWTPLKAPSINFKNCETVENEFITKNYLSPEVEKNLLMSETLYAIKPMVHLISMSCFGQKNWKPWVISLILDITCLQFYNIHRDKYQLDHNQRLEVSRRHASMLIYLLRSPFYDKYSKEKIFNALEVLSKRLPLLGLICGPLRQYLPFWQDTYSWVWLIILLLNSFFNLFLKVYLIYKDSYAALKDLLPLV